MNWHSLLNNIHSYNRYLVLTALVFVLYRSFSGWLGKKPYEKADNAGAAALLGLSHLQLLVGVVLYYGFSSYGYKAFANWSNADKLVKYIAIEHAASMFIAVVLIQLGRTFSKRATNDLQRHKTIAIYTSIAALLVIGTLAHKGLLFSTLAEVAAGQ